MHNFTVKITIRSYMFRVQCSHVRPCNKSMKGSYITVVYILILTVSGREHGLTYNGIYDCYIQKSIYNIKSIV